MRTLMLVWDNGQLLGVVDIAERCMDHIIQGLYVCVAYQCSEMRYVTCTTESRTHLTILIQPSAAVAMCAICTHFHLCISTMCSYKYVYVRYYNSHLHLSERPRRYCRLPHTTVLVIIIVPFGKPLRVYNTPAEHSGNSSSNSLCTNHYLPMHVLSPAFGSNWWKKVKKDYLRR